jgi:Fuc2NAc and GlcNAc transferase
MVSTKVFQFLISCLLSSIFIATILPKLRKKLIDTPNSRSSHHVPTPRGAGIAFVIVGTLLHGMFSTGLIRWIPFLCLPLAFVGFIDDRSDLPPGWRYLIQVVTAFMLLLTSRMEIPLWLIPVILIAITAIINFMNFMDGLDGLLAGCAVLLMAATSAWTISGSIFGFLLWNWSPAKAFMGDVGSTFIGALFVGFILQQTTPQSAFSLMLLGFPLFGDALITLIQRFFSKKNVFKPHRQHLYQRLNQAGWNHAQVASIYIFAVFTLIIARFVGGWSWLIGLIIIQILLGLLLDHIVAIKFKES